MYYSTFTFLSANNYFKQQDATVYGKAIPPEKCTYCFETPACIVSHVWWCISFCCGMWNLPPCSPGCTDLQFLYPEPASMLKPYSTKAKVGGHKLTKLCALTHKNVHTQAKTLSIIQLSEWFLVIFSQRFQWNLCYCLMHTERIQ